MTSVLNIDRKKRQFFRVALVFMIWVQLFGGGVMEYEDYSITNRQYYIELARKTRLENLAQQHIVKTNSN